MTYPASLENQTVMIILDISHKETKQTNNVLNQKSQFQGLKPALRRTVKGIRQTQTLIIFVCCC